MIVTRRAFNSSSAIFAALAGVLHVEEAVGASKFWTREEKAAGEVAIRELQGFLLNSIKDERGVHVETLMAASGGVAGFSAQFAIRKTIVEPGILPLHGGRDLNAGAFVIAGAKDGQNYYYGDLLNSYLIPQAARLGPGAYTLFGFLTVAVQKEGGVATSNEVVVKLFKNATSTAGGSDFGRFTLPEKHWPRVAVRELLGRTWPGVREILTKARSQEGVALPVKFWPAACALAAAGFIKVVKKALDPELAMRVTLEAAIPMSKVDPKTVPSGN